VIARTLQVEVEPERIDAVLEAYREDVRPIHARAEGLQQHYVLVDREQGLFVGLWVPAIHSLGALVLAGERNRE